jgi:hypothetical protein
MRDAAAPGALAGVADAQELVAAAEDALPSGDLGDALLVARRA